MEVPLTAEVEHATLRSEWQYRVQRLDSLHDEAWAIQDRQHERMTEIWLEVQRHRARIGEIAALGVPFDDPDAA